MVFFIGLPTVERPRVEDRTSSVGGSEYDLMVVSPEGDVISFQPFPICFQSGFWGRPWMTCPLCPEVGMHHCNLEGERIGMFAGDDRTPVGEPPQIEGVNCIVFPWMKHVDFLRF